MQWADDVRIETPEQIDVSLEVAGLGSRFEALVIDRLIRLCILALVALPLGLILALLQGALVHVSLMFFLLLLGIIDFAITQVYHIYYEGTRNGHTPGKRIAGIRVVRDNGAPVDLRSAAIRNLLRVADLSLVCYPLGALVVLLNARGQRLGDMAAGTLVVRERALEVPVDPLKQLSELASDEFALTGEQLAACSPQDRHILRSFFQRFREMEPRARHLLALRLADQFTQKMAYQPRHDILDGPSAQSFLATLYRDLENRARLG
jgi:uncharacterized RDD family membrane protein YckC